MQKDGTESSLEIRSEEKRTEDAIIEGILLCPRAECQAEYPVIDGIPILVPDLRTYVSQHIFGIVGRDDLTSTSESILGDCCGPGSALDLQRQYLSTYCFDHYGDLDPEESGDSPGSPGCVARLLRQGLSALGNRAPGPAIDIGCAVGRASFELAQATDGLVLGVDLNFGMLRTTARIQREGRIRYSKRRGGVVFERREFPARFEKAENVDFWVCDATRLPFRSQTFGLCASLNVVDCVASPYDHLAELSRVLMPGSGAVIATPYDWNAAATPVDAWVGGHSQRSANQGASDVVLRSLFAGGEHPAALDELVLESELGGLPWTLRLHDRSVVTYQLHMILARKRERTGKAEEPDNGD